MSNLDDSKFHEFYITLRLIKALLQALTPFLGLENDHTEKKHYGFISSFSWYRKNGQGQKPVSQCFLEDFFNANSIKSSNSDKSKKSFLVAGRRDERSEAKEQKPDSASSAAVGIPESVTGCWPISIINLEHTADWKFQCKFDFGPPPTFYIHDWVRRSLK